MTRLQRVRVLLVLCAAWSGSCAAPQAGQAGDEDPALSEATGQVSALSQDTRSDRERRRSSDSRLRVGDSVSLESVNYPDRLVRHQNFLGFLHEIDRDSPRLDREDATFIVVDGKAGEGISLRSKNYPDRFLRHQSYRIKLQPDDGSAQFKWDSTFNVQPGLAGAGLSLESFNAKGYFIRHRSFELWLDPRDSSALYREDASFRRRSPR